jgi:hypothetical protein
MKPVKRDKFIHSRTCFLLIVVTGDVLPQSSVSPKPPSIMLVPTYPPAPASATSPAAATGSAATGPVVARRQGLQAEEQMLSG